MKRMMFLMFITLMACSPNMEGEKYYYLTPDEALDVGFPFGAIVYKSPKELIFREITISASVVSFKQTSKFISVKQQTDINLLKKWINEDIKGFLESKGYNGERRKLKFYDVVLTDTFLLKFDASDSSINYLTNLVLQSPRIKKMQQRDTNYWVIQKSIDSLIGPLTKSEFEYIREEMSVSSSLKLD